MRRFGLGVLVVLMLFAAWQVLTRFVAYTDDAYVRSDLIALAPQVTGRIVTVAVTDNQVVHRGDLLVEIDPEPFQLAVNASQAKLQQAGAVAQAGRASRAAAHDQLDSATAQSTDAQDLERRMAALGPSGAFSRDEEDEALATSRSSQARVAAERATIDRAQSMLGAQQAAIGQAQAELASAEWRLAKTKIFAPMDGTISNLNVQVGDTADADQPLIGIIAANAWRVVANYKQSYLSSIHPGTTAWIWLDAHPWHFYRARIRSIGRGIDRRDVKTFAIQAEVALILTLVQGWGPARSLLPAIERVFGMVGALLLLLAVSLILGPPRSAARFEVQKDPVA